MANTSSMAKMDLRIRNDHHHRRMDDEAAAEGCRPAEEWDLRVVEATRARRIEA